MHKHKKHGKIRKDPDKYNDKADSCYSNNIRIPDHLYDNVPVGLYRTRPDGAFVYVNSAAAAILGYERPEELMDQKAEEIYLNPVEREGFLKQLNESGYFHGKEIALKRKDGSAIWAEVSARPCYDENGKITNYDGYIVDITEKKMALDSLKVSEAKFRLLSENIKSAIFIFNRDGVFTYVNPATIEVTGYPEKELKKMHFYEVVHPEFRDLVKQRGFERVSGGEVPQSYEFKILTKGGKSRWVEISNKTMDLDGEAVVLGTAIDITERKEAAASIEKSEEKYKSLYTLFRMLSDNEPDMIWAKDLDNRYIFVNKALCKKLLHARNVDEPIGKTDLYFARRERKKNPGVSNWYSFDEKGREYEKQVIQSRVPVRTEESGYVRGELLYLDILRAPFWDENGNLIGTVGSARDITRQKAIEMEKQRAQELQALVYRIGSAVSTAEDLETLFRVIIEELDKLISTSGLFILFYNENTGEAYLPHYFRGVGSEETHRALRSLTSFMVSEGSPLFLDAGRLKSLQEKGKISLYGERPVAWMGVPLKAKGKVIGALCVLTDEAGKAPAENDLGIMEFVSSQIGITINQKKTEESLRESELRLRKIIDTVPHMIYVKDMEGKFIMANKYTAEVYGLSVEELEGKYQHEVHENEKEVELFIKEDISVIKNNKTIFIPERHFTFADGVQHILQTIKIPFRFVSGEDAVIGVSFDVTEQKKFELDLQKAKERAEESDKLKTAFLANMSHEIRTPMNAIVGFSELLNDPALNADIRKEYIDLINENSRILLNLIEDIIDVAKIEADQIKIVRSVCQVNRIIDELAQLFREEVTRLGKKNLKVFTHKEIDDKKFSIRTDPLRFRQILNNLLGNAVKFTQEGFIEFGYNTSAGDRLLFYVKDTGIGLPEDKIKIIFERFRQAEESTTREYGGTGLGLTISKKLVELLDGEMWVQSQPGEGSTFYFTLPWTETDGTGKDEKEILDDFEADWSGKTILVAEDEESNFELVSAILAGKNLNILHAVNGKQAVELFRKHQNEIDLVLMDIRMPEMSGYEATGIIKKIHPDVIVISLTAYAMAEDRDKSIAAGCNDHISKPIRPADLIKTIRKYFDN